ncbi:unnamed protein product [Paramecium octaurelia]|uniref:Tetratricopeptide repeat protein 26 n=1 Tax=Paramecium octaurelia TaxID=43137 RepID=A0A8S1Y2R3_PAROT|nr:unnamed protein product [Paramecium octaurelia]
MLRPGSSMSKAKQTKGAAPVSGGMAARVVQERMPTMEEYVKNRDWVGAISLLENEQNFNDSRAEPKLWLAYACFHNGEYKRAIQVYDQMMTKPDYNKEIHIYKACCFYALCQYEDAKRECSKGPETPLSVRLQFHIAHKKNDEKNLMTYHHKIQETVHDQLCLAAIHYLRGHYEEATDAYKKLLLENREYTAINVYIALCYYKLEYFDVSIEILSSYLNQFPQSVTAINLKACNQFQLYSGKLAEEVFKPLQQQYEGINVCEDNDLLKHNLVVFRAGENALKVLPPLVEIFPEAKLNLIVYYLKNEDITEAFNLVQDLQPTNPKEYILKAVVFAMKGQSSPDQKEALKTSQQLFQLVGSSASECDTIPGRQCMASCFFLLKQYEDVLVYLKSIKQFFQNDDDFNWNYGIACAGTGDYKEAEDALTQIQSEKYRSDDIYIKWMTRTYIMNGKAKEAWELYINMETSSESFQILVLIANDCYKMGHFYYAAKAFDILQRLDSDNGEHEYEDALRGAVVGVFQMVITSKETLDHLIEVMNIITNTGDNPQVEYILKIIKKWGKENNWKI